MLSTINEVTCCDMHHEYIRKLIIDILISWAQKEDWAFSSIVTLCSAILDIPENFCAYHRAWSWWVSLGMSDSCITLPYNLNCWMVINIYLGHNTGSGNPTVSQSQVPQVWVWFPNSGPEAHRHPLPRCNGLSHLISRNCSYWFCH